MVLESDQKLIANRDVKALLFPASRFESLLEKLIELLPRQKKQLMLTPIRDIEVLSLARGDFRSTGSMPMFAIDFVGGVESGWFYLELALARKNGSRVATIVADFGDEKQEILVPSILRGSIREVIFLREGVKNLMWIPTAAPGYFSQSPLQLHQITRVESFFRRAYRVICDLWRFRNVPLVGRAGLTWTSLLYNLQEAYKSSARVRIQRLSGNSYKTFVARYGTLRACDVRDIRRKILKFSQCPLFSVIMPLREDGFGQLNASLSSITEQLYENWELIIVSASELNDSALALVNSMVDKGFRVKVVIQKSTDASIGIETADLLNCGLTEAQGEWVIRINPNDRLPQDSVFYLAAECNQFPDALFIYGDDDQIDREGRRRAPRFKPDWNPDLLTSHDYIGNPVIYNRSRLLQLGGYAHGFEFAEGYELSLRYLKGVPKFRIRHIHKVLYHQYYEMQDSQKDRLIHEAGRLALERYFKGAPVSVESGVAQKLYRIRWKLPSPPPLVSIIIPTRDKADLLRACVESVQLRTDYPAWEILIVDNGSVEVETQNYFQELNNDPRIRVLKYDAPFNYSAINNYAVTQAQGEILVLLNNDIEVICFDWLSEMVGHAIRPEIGAVGAKLLYPDGTVQHGGVVLGIGGVAGHAHRFLKGDAPGYCHRAVVTQNLSAVTGACLVVRKNIYQEVGGLNDEYLHVAFNDIDFCLKLIEAGYWNIITPYALLCHHESVSRGVDDTVEKKEIFSRESDFMKKHWCAKLDSDFAYNKNLTLDFEDFSFRI